ncbi:MAG: phosphatidylglycerophosphatase A [Oligoflexia bacterium]|nr:phosphatidylglycerophosphatase A [Oligoflexia bacterium]
MNLIVKLLATGFGVGYIPWGPGTYGTFLAVPLFVFITGTQNIQSLLFIFFFTVLAVIVSTFAGQIFSKDIHQDDATKKNNFDDKRIVIDEIAGFLVATCWLPVTWQTIALAVPIFRTLDIFKPGPIGFVERRIKGGLGVVADDIVAGIITNIILQIVYNTTSLLGTQL